MKMKKQIREALIQELGDTTDAYPFKVTEREVRPEFFKLSYSFKTDKGTTYDVYTDLFVNDWLFVYVEFVSDKGGYTVSVNEGTTFRVMATIVHILSEFWENRFDLLYNQPTFGTAMPLDVVRKIKGFRFDVSSKDPGLAPQDTQRFKLYRAFIERQFPSAEISIQPPLILVAP